MKGSGFSWCWPVRCRRLSLVGVSRCWRRLWVFGWSGFVGGYFGIGGRDEHGTLCMMVCFFFGAALVVSQAKHFLGCE